MSNVSIAGYAGWPAYDTFLIVSLSGRLVYDPNQLRPNPNPKKPVSGSCRVRGLGRTLTPLISSFFMRETLLECMARNKAVTSVLNSYSTWTWLADSSQYHLNLLALQAHGADEVNVDRRINNELQRQLQIAKEWSF